MARKPRIEYPGAVYHVTGRGNARADIFIGDDDRVDFLHILGDTVARCGWIVHAYCLMTNHFHLLVETPNANLGKGMQLLCGTYTARFNRRNRQVGHVFQGRYKAVVIEKESHLLEVARYVALNPVRAQMVERVADYPWSSYRATIGLAGTPPWLTTDDILGRFHPQRKSAQRAYVKFVEGMFAEESPFGDTRLGVALGSDAFVEGLKPLMEESLKRDRSSHAEARRPALAEILGGCRSKKERDLRMAEAHDRYGYTLAEIGEVTGMHFTSVSRAMKRARASDETKR